MYEYTFIDYFLLTAIFFGALFWLYRSMVPKKSKDGKKLSSNCSSCSSGSCSIKNN